MELHSVYYLMFGFFCSAFCEILCVCLQIVHSHCYRVFHCERYPVNLSILPLMGIWGVSSLGCYD